MASYPYYPVNYGNPYSYLPQGYQPVMPAPQVQQQFQTQSQPTTGIIWISGLQEAQMYPVAPNNAVALWEQSGKAIYLKQADATGKPTIRIYDLVERTETASTASSAATVKTPEYITKEELAEIIGVLKGLTGDIEQMKGDLYGVAGRMKTAKKEVTDDDA